MQKVVGFLVKDDGWPKFWSWLLFPVFLFSGNLGNEAIVVTKSDEVFAIGSNAAGCLGLGDLQSTLFPKKVEALCSKSVKGMIVTLALWSCML
jgi:Regulator of chromosome condensation (RCC1) repeat.